MKKILNNDGLTLIEVVVAAVILSIIAVPLLSMLVETTKLNVNSDVEIKMNSEITKVIEGIKAGNNITGPLYYDKLFNTSTNSSQNYYVINIDTSKVNQVSIGGNEYDFWDINLIINSDGTCLINKNSGNHTSSTYKFLPESFDSTPRNSPQDMTFTSYISNDYWLETSFIKSAFTSGYGRTITPTSPVIVNIQQNDLAKDFVINASNKINSTIVNNKNVYRSIFFKIFNDPENKIIINSKTPYIDISRSNAKTSSIVNGKEVVVTVSEISPNKEIKKVTTVIGKDIN